MNLQLDSQPRLSDPMLKIFFRAIPALPVNLYEYVQVITRNTANFQLLLYQSFSAKPQASAINKTS